MYSSMPCIRINAVALALQAQRQSSRGPVQATVSDARQKARAVIACRQLSSHHKACHGGAKGGVGL